MRSVAYGWRKEIRYGSNNFIYLRLRAAEEDEQSLGSGQGDEAWDYVHALGLGSCNEQRHRGALRRGLRVGFAEPLAWRLEEAGTERHGNGT